jgi:phosphoglycerate kinase
MAKLSITDLTELTGKRVLVRVDYNVPLDETGTQITDDKRIKATLPTVEHLIKAGAKVILCSHLGRPKGKRDPKQSLKPCAARLGEMLKKPVTFLDDCIGAPVESAIAAMKPGDVALLENLRFYAEEEKNDAGFSAKLAKNADVYVNDAFGSAHRAHASTEGAAQVIKQRGGQAAAGFLMEKELKYLGGALANPARPFVCILGGAKVSDKIKVIENLLQQADALLIGGAMAYTFLKVQGYGVGSSLVENDKLDLAKSLLETAKNRKFLLPVDHLVATKPAEGAETQITANKNIDAGWCGVDIGPKTIEMYNQVVAGAKTIVWNGPMGIFEIPAFSKGTFGVAQAVVQATQQSGATSIIGGGDSAKAVKKAGVDKQVTFVSTGGGASLEFLEGNPLPGVAALSAK